MAIELANHIYRDGEGVPVVLMNAYPVDHRMWDVCAKALGRLRRPERQCRTSRSGLRTWPAPAHPRCRATPIRAPAWRTARTARRWIAGRSLRGPDQGRRL